MPSSGICSNLQGRLRRRVFGPGAVARNDNAAAHFKSALISPSVAMPISTGELALGACQNTGPAPNESAVV